MHIEDRTIHTRTINAVLTVREVDDAIRDAVLANAKVSASECKRAAVQIVQNAGSWNVTVTIDMGPQPNDVVAEIIG